MRRDTQIGIVLGVVILVVIGVFLSTRTSDKDTDMPDLILSEEAGSEPEIQEIDIKELMKDTKASVKKEITPFDDSIEEDQVIEEFAKATPVGEYPDEALVGLSADDTTLEGKWKGTDTTNIKPKEAPAEIARQIQSVEEKTIPDINQEVKPVEVHGNIIHKVQPNDNLFSISRKYYGDVTKWKKIYQANKDHLSDPDDLYVGQEILIPELTLAKTETEISKTQLELKPAIKTPINTGNHTVRQGDTLYSLARKYYNDPDMWSRIYDVNKDTIEDKRLLKAGQVLIIP